MVPWSPDRMATRIDSGANSGCTGDGFWECEDVTIGAFTESSAAEITIGDSTL